MHISRLFFVAAISCIVPCFLMAIVVDSLLCNQLVGASHLIQYISHPVLHFALCDHTLSVLHHLSLAGHHSISQRFLVRTLNKPQLGNVVKHLKRITEGTMKHFMERV